MSKKLKKVPVSKFISEKKLDKLEDIVLHKSSSYTTDMIERYVPDDLEVKSTGTNRIIYIHTKKKYEDLVFKIAYDSHGIEANFREFYNGDLDKRLTYSYSISKNGVFLVQERVRPLRSKDMTNKTKKELRKMLSKLENKLLLIDCKISNFANFGIRKNGDYCLLDHGDTIPFPKYQSDNCVNAEEEFNVALRCRGLKNGIKNDEVCGGKLEYTEDYDMLVCKKCGKACSVNDAYKDIWGDSNDPKMKIDKNNLNFDIDEWMDKVKTYCLDAMDYNKEKDNKGEKNMIKTKKVGNEECRQMKGYWIPEKYFTSPRYAITISALRAGTMSPQEFIKSVGLSSKDYKVTADDHKEYRAENNKKESEKPILNNIISYNKEIETISKSIIELITHLIDNEILSKNNTTVEITYEKLSNDFGISIDTIRNISKDIYRVLINETFIFKVIYTKDKFVIIINNRIFNTDKMIVDGMTVPKVEELSYNEELDDFVDYKDISNEEEMTTDNDTNEDISEDISDNTNDESLNEVQNIQIEEGDENGKLEEIKSNLLNIINHDSSSVDTIFAKFLQSSLKKGLDDKIVKVVRDGYEVSEIWLASLLNGAKKILFENNIKDIITDNMLIYTGNSGGKLSVSLNGDNIMKDIKKVFKTIKYIDINVKEKTYYIINKDLNMIKYLLKSKFSNIFYFEECDEKYGSIAAAFSNMLCTIHSIHDINSIHRVSKILDIMIDSYIKLSADLGDIINIIDSVVEDSWTSYVYDSIIKILNQYYVAFVNDGVHQIKFNGPSDLLMEDLQDGYNVLSSIIDDDKCDIKSDFISILSYLYSFTQYKIDNGSTCQHDEYVRYILSRFDGTIDEESLANISIDEKDSMTIDISDNNIDYRKEYEKCISELNEYKNKYENALNTIDMLKETIENLQFNGNAYSNELDATNELDDNVIEDDIQDYDDDFDNDINTYSDEDDDDRYSDEYYDDSEELDNEKYDNSEEALNELRKRLGLENFNN